MVKEGRLRAEDFRFAIVVARFNSFITDRLLEGAIDCLRRHGARDENVEIYKVPGAFEIPLLAKKVAKREGIDAVICLGAVIKGDTPHFHYIASETTKGIAQVSLETEKPIVFGVITAETLEEAIERAGTKAGNKGFEAALSAIEMVNLMREAGL